MIRFSLFCAAALLLAAVPAAQRSAVVPSGHHARGNDAVQVAHQVSRPRGHREAGRFLRRVAAPVVSRVPQPRGHWEDRCEQVLVPGYWTEQHVPPTYGWIRGHCGRREWGIVAPGGCQRTWVPARFEHRTRRVWVGC
jgi:hypothetical protein